MNKLKSVFKGFGFGVKVLVNALISLIWLNLVLLLLSIYVDDPVLVNVFVNWFIFIGLVVFEYFSIRKNYYKKGDGVLNVKR